MGSTREPEPEVINESVREEEDFGRDEDSYLEEIEDLKESVIIDELR